MLFPSEKSLESFDFESEINSLKLGVMLEETECRIFFFLIKENYKALNGLLATCCTVIGCSVISQKCSLM